jgi:hypothetical protein
MGDLPIPTGWTYITYCGGGVALQIVIPASGGGVRHVLDSISVKLMVYAAGAPASYEPGIDVLDGATSIVASNLGLLSLDNTVGSLDSDEIAGDGIAIGSPATSMTVRVASGAAIPAGIQGVMRITGHDV